MLKLNNAISLDVNIFIEITLTKTLFNNMLLICPRNPWSLTYNIVLIISTRGAYTAFPYYTQYCSAPNSKSVILAQY